MGGGQKVPPGLRSKLHAITPKVATLRARRGTPKQPSGGRGGHLGEYRILAFGAKESSHFEGGTPKFAEKKNGHFGVGDTLRGVEGMV